MIHPLNLKDLNKIVFAFLGYLSKRLQPTNEFLTWIAGYTDCIRIPVYCQALIEGDKSFIKTLYNLKIRMELLK